ncbi:MAG TPA: choice-of-anchor V domain-containing protein [Bryobacteraceae bacterium]|nr:choice-of-anchor V domain-containing protein [Bryobacteraceae bacterium]
MKQRKRLLFAKSVAILSTIPALIYGFASGPLPNKSGAPGGGLCTECHVGSAAGTSIAVTAASGTTYTPGQAQQITVRITEAANVYGFQATARTSGNQQAGSFTSGAGMKVISGEGFQFIEHNTPSSNSTFTFQWTPPANASGDITIYAAGNAANGNGDHTGDHIHSGRLTLTAAGSQQPRPTIGQNGVLNGASFQPQIAAGTWVSVFGTNFASAERFLLGSDLINGNTLPTELEGVRVEIDGRASPIGYLGPSQINVLAPDGTSSGPVRVEVRTAAGTSEAAIVTSQAVAPAFFLYDPEGRKYIAAQHGVGNAPLGKAGLVAGSTPAAPGETIILYATGLGPTDPAVPVGRIPSGAARIRENITVRFGETAATVDYAGVSTCCAGLYQINVVVPATVQSGDVAVRAQIGSLQTQPDTFITIQAQQPQAQPQPQPQPEPETPYGETYY